MFGRIRKNPWQEPLEKYNKWMRKYQKTLLGYSDSPDMNRTKTKDVRLDRLSNHQTYYLLIKRQETVSPIIDWMTEG